MRPCNNDANNFCSHMNTMLKIRKLTTLLRLTAKVLMFYGWVWARLTAKVLILRLGLGSMESGDEAVRRHCCCA
jgi:hypothetical protein